MHTAGPHFVTNEIKQKLPILIIDKKGKMGVALAEKLKEQFLIVLVSGKELDVHENIIHIPYRKKIPLIPDNAYSHIFIFYNGEDEIIDMLVPFVKKANETNAKLFLLTSIKYSNKELHKQLSAHQYHGVRTIIYGEIFDNQLSEVNELTFFIHQVRTTGSVEIPNEGLGIIYPVAFEDALNAFIAIAFAFEKRHKVLLAFHKTGITELSAIRILQKLNPDIKLRFRKVRDYANDYFIPEEAESVYPDYNYETKLKKVDLERKIHYVPSPKKKIRIPRQKTSHSRAWIAVTAAVFAFLLPVILIFSSSAAGAWAMQNSVKQAGHGKFSDAKNSATIAQYSFGTAKFVTGLFGVVDAVAQDQRQGFLSKLEVGQQAAQTEIEILDAGIVLQKIYAGQSPNPKDDFLQALATIKNSLLVLQKMRAENQLPESMISKLNEMNGPFTYFENTIDAYPSLLGFEGKRKYLVLFQNNMELRPTGGFIGSFGILEIENGRSKEFKILDVYDADGKLNTHVEPPYGLRRYLGVVHWYLRDSNMDPDFTKSAEEAEKFLGLEVGEKVDGVIAIDTDFLKSMLSAFGSVTVTDYNVVVRPENFYMLTQTYAEKDFFPGSTQKKDFLRALSSAMTLELSQKNNISWGTFAKKVGESIQQKHLLFAFSDPAIQKLFTVNNMSSSLWDGRKAGDNTFLDTFGVIDANVGVNKANYYVNRSIQQNTIIDDIGNLRATATITYENTSSKSSPFGGDYKNFVRFLLPENASLQSVKVDGQELSVTPAETDPAVYTQKNYIPSSGLEVEETQEADKKLIGFFFIVPAGATRKVAITYDVDNIVNVEDPAFSYNLLVFKQPGTGNDPYSLFVTYPSAFKLIQGDKGVVDVGGKLSYTEPMSTDKMLGASFAKK